jgi:hypothetical protein
MRCHPNCPAARGADDAFRSEGPKVDTSHDRQLDFRIGWARADLIALRRRFVRVLRVSLETLAAEFADSSVT